MCDITLSEKILFARDHTPIHLKKENTQINRTNLCWFMTNDIVALFALTM